VRFSLPGQVLGEAGFVLDPPALISKRWLNLTHSFGDIGAHRLVGLDDVAAIRLGHDAAHGALAESAACATNKNGARCNTPTISWIATCASDPLPQREMFPSREPAAEAVETWGLPGRACKGHRCSQAPQGPTLGAATAELVTNVRENAAADRPNGGDPLGVYGSNGMRCSTEFVGSVMPPQVRGGGLLNIILAEQGAPKVAAIGADGKCCCETLRRLAQPSAEDNEGSRESTEDPGRVCTGVRG